MNSSIYEIQVAINIVNLGSGEWGVWIRKQGDFSLIPTPYFLLLIDLAMDR
jgi:hypothetical protein